ncbi:MAG TPA: cob(I)yrinic acid a,c-diamide adenosyltransferase [Lacipirellula sp.]
MKIYTRIGDAGLTGLYGGGRVPKNDIRIAAYGTVDELNAALGLCRAAGLPAEVDDLLGRLQHDMFALGAELATAGKSPPGAILLDDSDVARIEAAIDHFDDQLQPLKTFILPGGAPTSAALHVARAVCRRAEREVVNLAQATEVRPTVLIYLNRISDLLFVLARFANRAAGVGDVLWEKKQA